MRACFTVAAMRPASGVCSSPPTRGGWRAARRKSYGSVSIAEHGGHLPARHMRSRCEAIAHQKCAKAANPNTCSFAALVGTGPRFSLIPALPASGLVERYVRFGRAASCARANPSELLAGAHSGPGGWLRRRPSASSRQRSPQAPHPAPLSQTPRESAP